MPIDFSKTRVSKSFAHERILTACAYSRCGRFLAAGGQDEALVLWNVETGDKMLIAGHRSWISAVAFQAEPKRLYSADYHGVLRAWNYESAPPTEVWARPDAHRGWIRTLLAAPDGNLLTAGNDRVIRIWSPEGKVAREVGGLASHVFSLAFHPDGKSFVSGDLLGNVQQWDYATGALVRTLDAKRLHTRGEDFLADVGGVRSLAFDKSGRRLACGGMTDAKSNTFCPGDPAVLIFEWDSGKLLQTLRPKHKSDGPINALAFLDDETLAGHAEHLNGVSSLEFWNIANATPVHSLQRESGYCLALHPSGDQLAAATFKNHGRGGNGRHSMPTEYQPHHGEVAVLLWNSPG